MKRQRVVCQKPLFSKPTQPTPRPATRTVTRRTGLTLAPLSLARNFEGQRQSVTSARPSAPPMPPEEARSQRCPRVSKVPGTAYLAQSPKEAPKNALSKPLEVCYDSTVMSSRLRTLLNSLSKPRSSVKSQKASDCVKVCRKRGTPDRLSLELVAASLYSPENDLVYNIETESRSSSSTRHRKWLEKGFRSEPIFPDAADFPNIYEPITPSAQPPSIFPSSYISATRLSVLSSEKSLNSSTLSSNPEKEFVFRTKKQILERLNRKLRSMQSSSSNDPIFSCLE